MLLSLGKDLGSGLGDRDGVLGFGAAATVPGSYGPAVAVDVVVDATECQDGVYGEGEPRF